MKKIYSIEEIRSLISEHKNELNENFHVSNFLLFGSYAKNEQTENSDIDLLVNFQKPIDMFKFMDLQEYLSELFGKKVDLGTPNSLKPYIKSIILGEAISL